LTGPPQTIDPADLGSGGARISGRLGGRTYGGQIGVSLQTPDGVTAWSKSGKIGTYATPGLTANAVRDAHLEAKAALRKSKAGP
jgi:hypothetical protein